MSKRASQGRQKVIEAAANILATNGLKGVSIRELSKFANAPLGSTYHNFPNGKQQIVLETLEWAGERAALRLKECLEKDKKNGLQLFLVQWREKLVKSNFEKGCPIVAAAVEASQEDNYHQIRNAIAKIFNDWRIPISDYLITLGHSKSSANSTAITLLACLEGAVILCRGYKDIDPFDAIIDSLPKLILVN
ncbi:TetR/AcrR family transcriptional regulator [Glaciecola sp. 1036]|uniref:TetR/AcrR family transcriptional regulator n=1 Tax=Alteromonadaceae TaxID=72275 RepID=UPI003D03ADB6